MVGRNAERKVAGRARPAFPWFFDEYIQASGSWENRREHGLQFRVTFLRVTAPTSAEGMEKYLGSSLVNYDFGELDEIVPAS
jgi:hypothetical protein